MVAYHIQVIVVEKVDEVFKILEKAIHYIWYIQI